MHAAAAAPGPRYLALGGPTFMIPAGGLAGSTFVTTPLLHVTVTESPGR